MLPTPDEPLLAPAADGGPLAFLRRHYRGDYSLARSYWVHTLLVSLFAPVLGLMLLPWLTEQFPARYGAAAVLLLTALGTAAWFWAIRGTWASAGLHVQRGGARGWATLAKCVIVLGVLRTGADLVNMMPALAEHLRVAAGEQFGSTTRVQVRVDGRSIQLSGGINDGSAAQLAQALQNAPSVTTVVLSSEGGWIREGRLLADVIRRRGLNTYVEDHCASACTMAFLAGKERAAAPAARIGFHASRGVGSLDRKPSAQETAQLAAFYRAAGLPDAFVHQAIDTPNETMWYPSHEALLVARVLTRTSLGGETAALSTAVRSKEALEQEFRKAEVFSALAERSPKEFDRLIDAAWVQVRQGAADAQVWTAARAQLAGIMPRFLPLARDETLIEYQALMQQEIEALRERDVRACVEMAFPSSSSMNVAGRLPLALKQREALLMAKMLREADPARGIPPDPQALRRIAQRAAKGMTPAQREVFADEAVRRRAAPAFTCDAAVQFFAGLNAIPVAQRSHALRVLYAEH